jgi:hypothetical protein
LTKESLSHTPLLGETPTQSKPYGFNSCNGILMLLTKRFPAILSDNGPILAFPLLRILSIMVAGASLVACPVPEDIPDASDGPNAEEDGGDQDNPDGGSSHQGEDAGVNQPQPDGGIQDGGGSNTLIDWCNLQWPESTSTTAGLPTETISGRIFVQGVTGEFGSGPSPSSQLGYGPLGSHPDADSGWTFADGQFYQYVDNGFGLIDNDEHQGTLTVSDPGTYSYTWRFSVDNGVTWQNCDRDGSDNGVDASQLGTLTVNAVPHSDAGPISDAGSPAGIDWCIHQHPAETTITPGVESETFYGRVFIPGVTGEFGTGPTPISQLGYGPYDTDPLSDAQWTWVNGGFYMFVDNGFSLIDNDEHIASISANDIHGEYRTAWRFATTQGGPWTYCDLDGSDNGFAMNKLGKLHVGSAISDGGTTSDAGNNNTDAGISHDGGLSDGGLSDGGFSDGGLSDGGLGTENSVDWCNLQWPLSLSVETNADSETIFGRVFENGMTGEGSSGGVIGQLGYGPDATDPDGHASWTWVDGLFSAYVDNGFGQLHNDEFTATLNVPAAGNFDYAWRFSADLSVSWTYCDLDGSGNGYQPSQAGNLVVPNP